MSYSFEVFYLILILTLTPAMGDLYYYDHFWQMAQKCFCSNLISISQFSNQEKQRLEKGVSYFPQSFILIFFKHTKFEGLIHPYAFQLHASLIFCHICFISIHFPTEPVESKLEIPWPFTPSYLSVHFLRIKMSPLHTPPKLTLININTNQ